MTKLLTLEMTILDFKMMVKRDLEFLYSEIERAPSGIQANLPGQFSLSGTIFLDSVAAALKRLNQFQNEKILDHFSSSFLRQK